MASQGRSLRQLLIKALQLSGEPIEAVGRVSIDGGFTRVSRFGRGYHRGPMEPLQILSALASLALISGVFIALLQLRGLRAQRHLEQVLRAYQPFLEENLTRAYWHVHHWDYRAYEDVRDYGLRFEVLAVALDARLTARGEPHASIA